ncbi:MAG: T9SS type A sorting domain-containing protein [Prevotellaceae bacterium]|nr:T9SS type A sorting domain-containing protein [Prevotellaceae bacterium]
MFLLAVALASPAAPAQEALQGLLARPKSAVSAPRAVRMLALSHPDTLELPFFDDFSQQLGAPNQSKWTDDMAFVNNTYGINPPTTGVATFDILDGRGYVYKHIGNSPAGADTLTSKPINLHPADAGVYLSFAYQPKGMSDDIPEATDSLTLQLFAPGHGWISAWHVFPDTLRADSVVALKEKYFLQTPHDKISSDADVTTKFFKVIIAVSDTMFLQPGFRFRFVSYATRSRSDVLGKLGNCDIWNLDLVYLNKNRTAADTMLADVAIATPPQKLLKEYYTMPWRHLKGSPTAQQAQLTNAAGTGVAVTFGVGNLGASQSGFVTALEMSCVKGASSVQTKRYSFGGNNILADTARVYTFNLPLSDFLNTPLANADSVTFEIKTIISEYTVNTNLVAELRANDTGVFRQNFHTCYAYDDGTAENGFGIFGANAANAKVALKYFSYLRDTLSGVYIHFNSTQDSGNMQQFKLAVWSDKGGLPNDDNMLYLEPNLVPSFDSLNTFTYYKLTHPVVVEGTFYVGWVQQASAMLNVGFDRNNRPADKMFVSVNGYTWQHSVFDGQGALMVRPSFASRSDYPNTAAGRQEYLLKVSAYPNPVRDELTLHLPDALREAPLQLEIVNLAGQRVRYEPLTSNVVNVSQLPQGAYFIRLSRGAKNVGYAKIVKN